MIISGVMYSAYQIGRQIYIERMSYKHPGYYFKPGTPILDKFKLYTASVVGDILTDKSVEKEGLNFLARLFTDKQTHEAAVILLKNVLNDPRFVEEARLFGVDLISNVVKTPQIQEDFKQLVIKTLQEEDVRKETIEILRYIAAQKESEDILAMYFKTIFLRDDLLKGVTGLLTKAAVETLENKRTGEKFGQFALKVASNEKVKGALYSNFIYKPAKRIFSFGYFTGEEEEAKEEGKK